MICPICTKKAPDNLHFCCKECWPRVPAKDRVMLYQMTARKQDTEAKWQSVIKKLKPLKK